LEGLSEARVKEDIAYRPLNERAMAKKRTGCGIGEANMSLRVDEKEGIAERIQQSAAFVVDGGEIILEPMAEGPDFFGSMLAASAKS
jgi:hypothetical protein